MLLSFFIVLNAMSEFDVQRAAPVLKSISHAFKNKEAGRSDREDFVLKLKPELHKKGDMFTQVEALFRSHIAGVGIRRNRFGDVMHVRLDTQRFEQGMKPFMEVDAGSGSAPPPPIEGAQRSELAPMLVSVLESDETRPYRMDIILNMPESPTLVYNEAPEVATTYIKQAESYAEALRRAGLPPYLVASGLGYGEEGTVDIFVYPHSAVSYKAVAVEESVPISAPEEKEPEQQGAPL